MTGKLLTLFTTLGTLATAFGIWRIAQAKLARVAVRARGR
jgi:hypothetical protein